MSTEQLLSSAFSPSKTSAKGSTPVQPASDKTGSSTSSNSQPRFSDSMQQVSSQKAAKSSNDRSDGMGDGVDTARTERSNALTEKQRGSDGRDTDGLSPEATDRNDKCENANHGEEFVLLKPLDDQAVLPEGQRRMFGLSMESDPGGGLLANRLTLAEPGIVLEKQEGQRELAAEGGQQQKGMISSSLVILNTTTENTDNVKSVATVQAQGTLASNLILHKSATGSNAGPFSLERGSAEQGSPFVGLKAGEAVLSMTKTTAGQRTADLSDAQQFSSLMKLDQMIKGESTVPDQKLALSNSFVTEALKQSQNSSGAVVANPVNPLVMAEAGRLTMPATIAFGQAGWAANIAEKAAWGVSQNVKTAEIQLDPPELGPLQIKIHVNNDQASVNFVSAHAQVRDVLDNSLAKLKEMLSEQGMELVDSGVSDQSPEDNHDDSNPQLSNRLISDDDSPENSPISHQYKASVSLGVDDFV